MPTLVRLVILTLLMPGVIRSAPIDANRLDREEDATESVANQLLDLSVALRDGDRAGLEAPWSDQVDLSGRLRPDDSASSVAGGLVRERPWHTDPEMRTAKRAEAADFLAALHDHFSSVEDARFKVKTSSFGPDESLLDLGLAFWIVGRNVQGARTWLRGQANAQASSTTTDGWRLHRFTISEAHSLEASREICSEVGVEAGVGRNLPFFDPGRFGIVWHGAAAGDLDRDGWMDVVAAGPLTPSVFLNRGDGTFEDVAELVGLAGIREATGPLLLDFDRDGDLDLFFAAVGYSSLMENRLVPDGALSFRDVSSASGVSWAHLVGFSAVAADVDGNGWEDIYVSSYNHYGATMPNAWHRADNGTPNALFLNQGDGTFREVARQWGVDDQRWSYAAVFHDIDDDGDADLYVANDFGENGLFRNDGEGFVDVAAQWGVTDPGNGMGAAFGDFDNDGHLDLHVTNMSSTAGNRILERLFPDGRADAQILKKLAAGNTLFRRLPSGTFVDVSADVGGLASGWAWGGGFFDLDNDGWEDLYTAAGFVSGPSMKDT